MPNDYLSELNAPQKSAVTAGGGPLLVVAGAGSGKTRTLAFRVAYLIDQGVAPERILLLTFTRRAANEMLNRAAAALGEKAGRTTHVWGGTFHAIANRLLRMYGQAVGVSPEFTILDQSDAEDMIQVIRQRKIAKEKKGRFPRKGTLLAIYSRRVNSGESLEIILKKLYPWCERWMEELKQIFKEYIDLKKARCVLDYDDLLVFWYYLLTDPQTAAIIEKRFDHILVDEYQDTNRLQADILVGMRQTNRTIMVVGDDAQSIYSFRAATVHNILAFPELFPGTETILLEQNYRSREPILKTTNALIGQARNRYSKELFSTRTGGDLPELITCVDEEHEADILVGKILSRYEQGVPLHKQAVLFRAGSHSAALELALIKKEVPFRKWGGLKFLEAAHVKDFIAYIKVAENPRDEIAWHRVLLLLEGAGPVAAAKVYAHLAAELFALASLDGAPVTAKIKQQLTPLKNMYAAVLSLPKGEQGLQVELETIGRFYLPLLEKTYDNPQPRSHDIEHIIALSSSYKSRTTFLTEIALDPPSSTSDLAGPPVRDEDYLVLSTIHSAKGCEWDVVYLIHAADGCLPSDMATDSEENIEEELRLTYVAMTRARDYLCVTWPLRFYSRPQGVADRYGFGQRSRFFSADVVATMQVVAASSDEEDSECEGLDMRIDVHEKMRGMWD